MVSINAQRGKLSHWIVYIGTDDGLNVGLHVTPYIYAYSVWHS